MRLTLSDPYLLLYPHPIVYARMGNEILVRCGEHGNWHWHWRLAAWEAVTADHKLTRILDQLEAIG